MKKIFKMLTILIMASMIVTFFESATPQECPPPEYTSPEIMVTLPDEDNCCYYYLCEWGNPTRMPCPQHLYYCSELGYCSYKDDWICSFSDCKYGELDPEPEPEPQCQTPWGRCYKTTYWTDPVTGKPRSACAFSGDPYESCRP